MNVDCAYSLWLLSHAGRWGYLDKSVSSGPVKIGCGVDNLGRHVLAGSAVISNLAVLNLNVSSDVVTTPLDYRLVVLVTVPGGTIIFRV
jgi:hypothetical protein